MSAAEGDPRPLTGGGPRPEELRRPGRSGAAAASALFLLVLVNWSWHLQPFRYTSDFYDVQARQLFHGHLSVPLDRIGLEAFRHGDQYHLYFGIFPTVLRMPLLLLTDRFDGRLTQPSMLLAWVVLLVAVRGLAWRTRVFVRGDVAACPVDRIDRVVACGAPVLVAAATPVLFLASVTAVYHEAILWGFAASLLAFDRLLVVLDRPSRREIVGFGAAALVAITSRASMGLAPCATAGALAVVALARGAARPAALRRAADSTAGAVGVGGVPRRAALALLAAAVLPLAAHVIVNEARFGTAMSPPYGSQVWTEISPERRAALEANDGSLFNVRYVPSTVLAYLRPDGAELSRLFPYVWFDPPARVVGDVVFDTRDRTASLTAVSPLLVGLAASGLVMLVRTRRRRPQLLRLALPVAASSVACLGVLTIGFVAQRYEGDLLLPAALLALPATYALLVRWERLAPRPRRACTAATVLLLAWSSWANLSIALLYQRLYVPVHDTDRRAFVDLQITMQRGLPGSIVPERADSAPDTAPAVGTNPVDAAPAGRFLVVGDCRALWWSDGTRWVELEPGADGARSLCRKLVDR